VVVATRTTARTVKTSRPDDVIRPGLVSVRGLDWLGLLETKGQDMSAKLTDNQTALLESASRRDDRCFVLPSNLKGGAAQKVAAKLITEGLAKEVKAKAGLPIWRRDADTDQTYSLKLSAAGAKVIATDEERSWEPELEAQAKAKAKVNLPVLSGASESSPHAADANKAPPREGSKLASVMALLRRSEGATLDVLTKTTGWLPHTMRAAITGVRKRGSSVVLDRSAEGASVYRLVDPQESEAATPAPSTAENNKLSPRQRGSKAKAAA
jgi:hypothetical protein